MNEPKMEAAATASDMAQIVVAQLDKALCVATEIDPDLPLPEVAHEPLTSLLVALAVAISQAKVLNDHLAILRARIGRL